MTLGARNRAVKIWIARIYPLTRRIEYVGPGAGHLTADLFDFATEDSLMQSIQKFRIEHQGNLCFMISLASEAHARKIAEVMIRSIPWVNNKPIESKIR